jgi:hypothetical protein
VYLAQVCGEDQALRVEVERLLDSYEKAGRFLVPENEQLEPGSMSEPEVLTLLLPVTEQAGDRIGRYKLLEQIGEGGWGVVYVAEQQEPVRRRVALKIIKLGMDTRNVIARFEAERQALGYYRVASRTSLYPRPGNPAGFHSSGLAGWSSAGSSRRSNRALVQRRDGRTLGYIK